MKVAIDKAVIGKIKDLNEFEYIYVFENEPLEDLLKLNLHCIHKDYVDGVDINLTSLNINCIKKANTADKEWKKVQPKEDYKFAIIIPNCNNDHGEYKDKTFLQIHL